MTLPPPPLDKIDGLKVTIMLIRAKNKDFTKGMSLARGGLPTGLPRLVYAFEVVNVDNTRKVHYIFLLAL